MLYSLMNLVRKGVHWRQHESSICSIFPKCVMCHWWSSFHLNITGDFYLIWYAIPLSYRCISLSPACAKRLWKHRNRYCHFLSQAEVITWPDTEVDNKSAPTKQNTQTPSRIVKPYVQQYVDNNVWTLVVVCKRINSPHIILLCGTFARLREIARLRGYSNGLLAPLNELGWKASKQKNRTV